MTTVFIYRVRLKPLGQRKARSHTSSTGSSGGEKGSRFQTPVGYKIIFVARPIILLLLHGSF
jgi:hypothetical protein